MLEFDIIETPENVEFQQRLAGIGSRFMAGLIDNLILLAVYAILAAVLMLFLGVGPFSYGKLIREAHWWVLALSICVFFFVYWGYFVFFELVMNGQSPGKRSMKLRVVKEGGAAIQFVDIAIRNLMRAVDGIGGYGVAGLSMFISRKVQRLGDLAAGTVVVSEETRDYTAHSDRRKKVQWEQEISPAVLTATGLKPEEYRTLYNYWARRGELTLEARGRLLPKLLTPILQRMGQTVPATSLVVLENQLDEMLKIAHKAKGNPPPMPPEVRP